MRISLRSLALTLALTCFALGSSRPAFAAAAPLDDPPTYNVAIFVCDGGELMDASGPTEVFVAAGFEGDTVFNVFTVAPKKKPITILGFGTLAPSHGFADCPRIDILVIPGGGPVLLADDEEFLGWVRQRAREAKVTMSVCSGAIVLAKAGLLDGLDATTHRRVIGRLRAAAPNTNVIEGRRYVDNGRIVTSAGVTAGIDAALHLVARFADRDTALRTATYLEYPWQPEETAQKITTSADD